METAYQLSLSDVVFIAMALAPYGGLAYAWEHWRAGYAPPSLALWRRAVATLALWFITLHALLALLMWIPPWSNQAEFDRVSLQLNPFFLAAVPCVLAGKGQARWWLLGSSVLLFVVCFFSALTA
jgi:hypothetical protein